MDEEFLQFVITAAKTNGHDGCNAPPKAYPNIVLTGLQTRRDAIDTLNRWLKETADRHNASPENRNDPEKYYIEAAVDTKGYLWPDKGYIYVIKDGKRENRFEFCVIEALPCPENEPLPEAKEFLDG